MSKIVRCSNCGEEYDSELFPVCPFCLNSATIQNYENNQKVEETICINRGEPDNDSVLENDSGSITRTDDGILNKKLDEINSLFDMTVFAQDGINKKSDEKECDILLEDIPMSVRCYNSLKRNHINSLFELREYIKKHDVYRIRNVGRKTAKEILEIANMDLSESCPKDDKSISSVFGERKYGFFVQYCKENGINSVEELSGFDWDFLLTLPGVGLTKVNYVIKKYEKYCKESGLKPQFEAIQNNANQLMFSYINDQLAELPIVFLEVFKISSKAINRMQYYGYQTVGALENIPIGKLTRIVGRNHIDSFIEIEPFLYNNLVGLFETILVQQSGTNDYDMTLLRSKGLTLQEIGERYGVSRERIRQLISKYLLYLKYFMKPISDFLMGSKGYISVNDLTDLYDNDDYTSIILYWCKKSGYLKYISDFDDFIPLDSDFSQINEKLVNVTENIVGEGIKISEHLEELEEAILELRTPYITLDNYLSFLRSHGYKTYGDYVVQGKASYGYLCSRIVADRFPNGIKMYDHHDLSLLRQYALEEYGDIGISDNDRALTARLADYLVLCGRGYAIAKESVHVEPEFLKEIKEFIDNNEAGKLFYSELYARYEGMIRMMSNIDNYHYLHGVLELYYPDDYDYAKDYLTKKDGNYVDESFAERLNRFIVEKGRPISKQEVKNAFPGTTDIVISLALSSSEHLLLWDYTQYYSIDLVNISKRIISHIDSSIAKVICDYNGYCGDRLLYDYMVENYPDDINQLSVTNRQNLYCISQNALSKKYDFRRPHIADKGSIDAVVGDGIAMRMLGNPDLLSYSEYLNLAKKLKWSSASISSIFNDMEKDYIRIGDETYLKKEKFCIDVSAVERVDSVMISLMENEYVSLLNFNRFEVLPDIGLEWNAYLLKSIIENYSHNLRIVENDVKDRRFVRGLVIKKEMQIHSFAELVAFVLYRNNIKTISENKLLSFLVANNLTYKAIPKELYNSEYLKYYDGVFEISGFFSNGFMARQ